MDMDGYGASSLSRPFFPKRKGLSSNHPFFRSYISFRVRTPQNLTTRYPKWHHIWSLRYIFQPAHHFLGIYPFNFLGVAIHMCSWCFSTGLCCHKDGWTKPGSGFLPRMNEDFWCLNFETSQYNDKMVMIYDDDDDDDDDDDSCD